MSKKMYRIASEGDMEDVLKVFITLSKSKVKQKTINIQVPTDKFSDIILGIYSISHTLEARIQCLAS